MADKAPPLTTEQIDWIRLSRSENVGPITFNRLIGRYKTAAKALDALPELIARGGAKRQIKICSAETIEKEYKELARNGGTFICSFEDIYPDCLKAIDDAPPVLSCLGNRDILNKNCLANLFHIDMCVSIRGKPQNRRILVYLLPQCPTNTFDVKARWYIVM